MTVVLSGAAIYQIWRKPKEGHIPYFDWSFIRRCWNGDLKLWKMFWVVTVGITVAIRLITYAATEFNAPLIWWLLVVALGVPLQVWWIVSLWRCAKNTEKRLWTAAARIVVVIQSGYYAYLLFGVLATPFGI